MKIKVSNLGTIKQTELDLRPLTVIIGPNNSSKTYLAYSIYGLLSRILDARIVPLEPGPLEEAITVELERSLVTVDERAVFTLAGKHLRDQCRGFVGDLEFFFQDTSGGLFLRTNFGVEVSEEELFSGVPKVNLRMQDESIPIAGISHAEGRVYLSVHPQFAERLFGENARYGVRLVLERAMESLFLEAVPSPFLLPAERNALIITYTPLSSRRLKLLRNAARGQAISTHDETLRRQMDLFREQGEIRYPQPIEDFLDFLTDVELAAGHRNAWARNPFVSIASMIEREFTSGGRLESTPTPLGGSELRLNLPEGPSIDLYNASSSIKQLTALLLYLRYRAAPNQLLIIDEPEMNLHPLAQAKLLEALAILVKLGVHVLLTTHSPYFMAHLANLTQAASTPAARKKQAEHLYLRDARALLTPEEVGAYEMRDNTLVSLADPDFGLRWDTLSDVFSDLQEKFFKLEGLAHGKARKKK